MRSFWYRSFPRLTFLARRLVRASYEREMELLDVLCDRTRKGLDIGAKVGMYTYRIRARSSDVVAFEPIPLFHHMLAAVFDGKRGRIEPVAVSNTHGKAVLRMPYDATNTPQFGRSTIDPSNPLAHVSRTEQLEVETRTIDSYAFDRVGFMKIDVEGHELAVLEGAEQTIATHQPNLLVECNDDHQPDAVRRLAEWMRAHDYDAHFVDVDRNVTRPIAQYDRAHWDRHFTENFICSHRSRIDVRERLDGRLATARMRQVAR